MARRTALFLLLAALCQAPLIAEDGLIAHWPLHENGKDVSGNDLHATPHGVRFDVPGPAGERNAAAFDGRNNWLEVADDKRLQPGTRDFSLAAWVRVPSELDDVPGDILSKYDAEQRRGFHFGVKNNAGVTFTQSNWKQLQFGIDQDKSSQSWQDRGRPGNAILAFALCEYDGALFAGTCEPELGQSGRVYRFQSPNLWLDCGAPDRSNAVTALVEYRGKLYAGTGKYRLRGSALTESPNETFGGRIYRYDGNQKWVLCGKLPEVESVGGLVVFRDRLYATSLYRPAAFFRYDGGTTWKPLPSPVRPKSQPGETTHMRVEALGVYNGWLYATSYDGGGVFRFDGSDWFDCGRLGENTQTYSFGVHHGRLFVGTWPSGRVYRMEAPNDWSDVGRLGEELEVMGMLVHNGRLIAGTLPSAQVYAYDGKQDWRRIAQLDHTKDVRYRRAWTMAEHGGQVFCSTLPSGKVYSWRAGQMAAARKSLSSGWRHVAAVRAMGKLRVYVDGEVAGESMEFSGSEYDLSTSAPLRIGAGPNDFFNGHLSDVRVYSRALTLSEVRELARR